MCKGDKEDLLEGMPKEYYDDEWQAKQRQNTKELQRLRKLEDEEEERKMDEYREIGLRLKGYPDEDVRKARRLVSSFIRAEEEVEEVTHLLVAPNQHSYVSFFFNFLPHQKIEEAAEKGELNELVLMVIWNRLDLARRDEEKDAVRGLGLLYRRVEMEILRREATPAMKLLNDLLNLNDGVSEEVWLKRCKKMMAEKFPREDPFSIIVPQGFDIEKHEGPMVAPAEDGDILLRVDFVREVDEFLKEVRMGNEEELKGEDLDAASVASKLKQQEKERAIRQVEALLDLAISLNS